MTLPCRAAIMVADRLWQRRYPWNPLGSLAESPCGTPFTTLPPSRVTRHLVTDSRSPQSSGSPVTSSRSSRVTAFLSRPSYRQAVSILLPCNTCRLSSSLGPKKFATMARSSKSSFGSCLSLCHRARTGISTACTMASVGRVECDIRQRARQRRPPAHWRAGGRLRLRHA